MATAAQINANRANAQHCTGPKTAEGRAASSRNAIRHGLYSTRVLMEGDDVEDFLRRRAEFFEEYKPQTPTEEALTNQVADMQWRLLRAERIEVELTLEALTAPKRDPDVFVKTGRLVSAARRDFEQTINQLRKIRAERIKLQVDERNLESMKNMEESDREFSRNMQELTAAMTSRENGFVSQNADDGPRAVPNDPAAAAHSTPPDTAMEEIGGSAQSNRGSSQ